MFGQAVLFAVHCYANHDDPAPLANMLGLNPENSMPQIAQKVASLCKDSAPEEVRQRYIFATQQEQRVHRFLEW